jgi:hypothetical protein
VRVLNGTAATVVAFNNRSLVTWNLAGNTAGFGQAGDGRPFWVGNFDGQGGTDILSYYPGDKTGGSFALPHPVAKM